MWCDRKGPFGSPVELHTVLFFVFVLLYRLVAWSVTNKLNKCLQWRLSHATTLHSDLCIRAVPVCMHFLIENVQTGYPGAIETGYSVLALGRHHRSFSLYLLLHRLIGVRTTNKRFHWRLTRDTIYYIDVYAFAPCPCAYVHVRKCVVTGVKRWSVVKTHRAQDFWDHIVDAYSAV